MTTERLTESHIDCGTYKVDRKNNRINHVKILGVESKNRRRYSERARASQAKLVEGMAVAMDHNRDDPTRERAFVDQPCVVRNVSVESDGNYGDLHVFPSHPSAKLLYDRAEMAPETFGLSHVAECKVGPPDRDGRIVVEDVEAVATLDLVTRPATTAGLFESEESQDKPMAKTLSAWLIEHKTKGTFKVLREMEELEVDPAAVEMAEEDVAEGIDPGEAVKTALSAKATEIFMDPAIDPKETGKKIAELAKAALDVAEKLEGKEPEEEEASGEEESGDESGGDDMMESVAPQLKKLTESLESLTSRDEARSFVESQDRRWVDIKVAHQKELTKAKTDADRAKVWESMTPDAQGAEKPAIGRAQSGGAFDAEAMKKEQNATPR